MNEALKGVLKTGSARLHGAAESLCPTEHGAIRLGDGIMLRRGRVHEVLGESAPVFAMAVAARPQGTVVWAGLHRDLAVLCPDGMADFIDPARLLLVEGRTRQDILWAGEQALRHQGIASVILSLTRGPTLTESRRLQLAAEESGALGLVLISERAHSSAAETRWQCTSLAITDRSDGEAPAPSSAPWCWRWDCQKNRQGETGAWIVTWLGKQDRQGDDNGQDFVHMAAATAA